MKILTINYIPKEILPRYGNSKKKLEIEEGSNYYTLNAKKCRKTIKLPKIINLTNKDLIAIGLYLAEGKKEKPHKNKNSNHNGEVSFDNSHPTSLDLFCDLIKKFGVAREELRLTLALNINYKDKVNKNELLAYWIKILGLTQKNVRNKWIRYRGVIGGRLSNNSSLKGGIKLSYASVILRNIFIPFTENFFKQMIAEKNKKAISLILKGYFAGDGHVTFTPKTYRRILEFLCNDHILRAQLREALQIIGITNLKETDPVNTKTHTHALRVYNRPDFLILQKYRVPDLVGYKRNTFNTLISTYKNPPPKVQPQ